MKVGIYEGLRRRSASYDGPLKGGNAPKHPPTGRKLSANQSVPVRIVLGRANAIKVTLGGIPASVVLVPSADSGASGSIAEGFTFPKCGPSASPTSATVRVLGVDAAGNDIIGRGAPTPSLTSRDPAIVAVASPSPGNPNTFTLVHPISDESQGPTRLIASVVPPSYSGGVPKSATVRVSIAGGTQICGAFTEFSKGMSEYACPGGIAVGSDGNLWFTEYCANKIGRITTTGVITEFSGLSGSYPYSSPVGIASGPGGNLWFTESDGNRIGRITTAGVVTEFSTGLSSDANPTSIVAGPDGAMWFTEPGETGYGGIGRITTAGTITNFTPPYFYGALYMQPFYIAAGPDGNLWFTAGSSYANVVGKITTAGVFTTYPAGSGLAGGIASGPDGNLWFAGGDDVYRATTAGAVTQYVPAVLGTPQSFAEGPDGAMWFSENPGSELEVLLVRIASDGTMSPGISPRDNYGQNLVGPGGLVTGPDGALWITEARTHRIGRLQ